MFAGLTKEALNRLRYPLHRLFKPNVKWTTAHVTSQVRCLVPSAEHENDGTGHRQDCGRDWGHFRDRQVMTRSASEAIRV